ncbi:hypothetical protein ACE1B6_27700 [Aerosakkonemataceae cyanobacterium BLCC-F154]|uniref:Uncharacterized protein n=1 Tax=Floridaenema fluviatile BLCC-F154 TaxID=3153640 RepID=A0ABV4YJP9_9CYAN
MSYEIFDEQSYLANNPDVKSAVAQGFFASGLQHFQLIGLTEGRTAVSPFWDEQRYLNANPDVRTAVNNGVFASGLQHYILFGETEGRPGAINVDPVPGFNENYYYALYPNVSRAVALGQISSAQTHYIRNGRFEGYTAFFSGTSGDDIVTGLGPSGSAIVGINVDINARITGQPDPIPTSVGFGEIDVLIGSSGSDSFGLGFGRSTSNTTIQRFYVGQGNNDYAYIIDFEPGKDSLQLAGSPNEYTTTAGAFGFTNNITGGVSIFTNTGDLVAAIEGVSSLQLTGQDTNAGIFFLT